MSLPLYSDQQCSTGTGVAARARLASASQADDVLGQASVLQGYAGNLRQARKQPHCELVDAERIASEILQET